MSFACPVLGRGLASVRSLLDQVLLSQRNERQHVIRYERYRYQHSSRLR